VRVVAATLLELAWLKKRAGCQLTQDARGLKAVDSYGATRGMVAFDSWTDNACQAHMATDTPIAWRALLPAALDYVFRQAGKGILLGAIPAKNVASIRFARAAGLFETHRVRDGWAVGEDLLLLELRREDCRFLSSERMVA
jgi:hypothetical protein